MLENNSQQELVTLKQETVQEKENSIKSTRNDYQLGRRLFHMSTGCALSTTYLLAQDLTHAKVVHILGLCACIIYLLDHVRISYPELAKKFLFINRFFLRAEEQLKESAAIPYALAVLLTILTFPKPVALIAIYTLAFSDPLSAIIGIRYGKIKITANKSLQGSCAFFVSTFVFSMVVLVSEYPEFIFKDVKASFMIALTSTLMEILPIRIDDNLTIPLYTSCFAWLFIWLFGLPV